LKPVVADSSDIDFPIEETHVKVHCAHLIDKNRGIHRRADASCHMLENRISMQYLPNGRDKRHRFQQAMSPAVNYRISSLQSLQRNILNVHYLQADKRINPIRLVS